MQHHPFLVDVCGNKFSIEADNIAKSTGAESSGGIVDRKNSLTIIAVNP
jgi:hypothetical protein